MSAVPTARLDIVEPANANEEILRFAADLEAKGERAWFEVHYPKPDGMSDEEFAKRDAETFDAVEVIDGEIHTLPPYELLGNPTEEQVK